MRIRATSATRKSATKDAGDFVILRVFRVMNHPIDAGSSNFIARLEEITNTHHGSPYGRCYRWRCHYATRDGETLHQLMTRLDHAIAKVVKERLRFQNQHGHLPT